MAGDVVQAAPALSEQVNAADSDRQVRGAEAAEAKSAAKDAGGFTKMVVSFGEAIGYFINTLLSSGRQSMKLVLNTIIPFMAYVSLLIGIVTYTARVSRDRQRRHTAGQQSVRPGAARCDHRDSGAVDPGSGVPPSLRWSAC